MENKTLIIILLGLLIIGSLCLLVDISNRQNVYEYLSDGKYDRALTHEEAPEFSQYYEQDKLELNRSLK